MRDFGRVFSSIWESTDFRGLTEDGRTLVLYLLTCQHGTLAGAFRLPDGYVSEDLQWSSERVCEGFADLARKGFASRCEVTKWVWVRKYLEWNPLENPNQRKSAAKIAEKVPAECQWRQGFMRVCGPLFGVMFDAQEEQSAKGSQRVPEQGEVEGEGTVEGEGEVVGAASPSARAPAAADAPAKRGARLAADWALPRSWGEWTLSEFPGWTADDVRSEAATFRDYWCAKAGKDSTKVEWEATWRNWCRKANQQRPRTAGAATKSDALMASNIAAAQRFLERTEHGS